MRNKNVDETKINDIKLDYENDELVIIAEVEIVKGIKTITQNINISKNPKTFYRVANNETQQGLWYDFNGNFTGLIHNKFNFCINSELPMPFDTDLIGWLSATETLEELYHWFTKDDIKKLEVFGYTIKIYEATEYKQHNNHWIIKQNSSKFIKSII